MMKTGRTLDLWKPTAVLQVENICKVMICRPSWATLIWSRPVHLCRTVTMVCLHSEFLRKCLHCLLKYWPTFWKRNKDVLPHDLTRHTIRPTFVLIPETGTFWKEIITTSCHLDCGLITRGPNKKCMILLLLLLPFFLSAFLFYYPFLLQVPLSFFLIHSFLIVIRLVSFIISSFSFVSVSSSSLSPIIFFSSFLFLFFSSYPCQVSPPRHFYS
jgi:hypothetical protein